MKEPRSNERRTDLGAFVGTERFSIVRELGAGSMGSVYEAIDHERQARVALKRLRDMSPDGLFRFKREFREFRELHHSNLVALHELHCTHGVWFFTMDLVDGVDFIRWVRPEHRLDERRLRDALQQLGAALLTLHSAHKVHRDIKPSNIVVTREARLILLDFGIASDAAVRSTDAVLGTVAYMAPEQALGEAVGPAADWYAAGVMLYEALTGQLPFAGSSYAMLIGKLSVEGLSPRSLNADAPEDLVQLCTELLAMDPDARPTAAQILERMSVANLPPRRAIQFVGRQKETARLLTSKERGCRSFSGVAVVGESGIGKTELVRHFVELAVRDDPQCLYLMGRCLQREQLPFQAVDGWMDGLSTALKRLSDTEVTELLPSGIELLVQVFPVLGRVRSIGIAPAWVGSPDLRERRKTTFSALRELFVRLSQRRHLVLVIDDAHWIDDDSQALLAAVFHEPDPPSVLFIATFRADEAIPVQMADRLERLQLGRLKREDATHLAELLGKRRQGFTPMDATRIAEQSDGHPLFIDVLARHVGALGATVDDLEEALAWQIRALSGAPRRVLEIASIATAPVPVDVASRAAELDPRAFDGCVNELCSVHLLRHSGAGKRERIEPYHSRIRAAVLHTLEADSARAMHARLAMSFEASTEHDLVALFGQFLAAGELGRAGHYARLAAERAAQALAFDQAAGFYEQCLSFDPLPQVATWSKLADVLTKAGRGGRGGGADLPAPSLLKKK
jgi:tRNA A-37 threonylcarbamoyl transferase component Bud32